MAGYEILFHRGGFQRHEFYQRIFPKKTKENIFSGILQDARKVPILSEKLRRIVKAVIDEVDRIIILADADGEAIDEKKEKIYDYVNSEYKNRVYVVLFDHEIEEWICYSKGFIINDKPSHILKRKLKNGYRKNQLPKYASMLDCKKLEGCESFRRLLRALSPYNN